jgi:hypothetical protein
MIIGIGTKEGGKIPLGYTALGEKRYKYFSGSEVLSSYNHEYLVSLAEKYSFDLFHIFDEEAMVKFSFGSGVIQKNISNSLLLFFSVGLILSAYMIVPYVQKS